MLRKNLWRVNLCRQAPYMLYILWVMPFYIFTYLHWCMIFQSPTCYIGRIISRMSTSWPVILSLFIWYVNHIEKSAVSKIPIQGSELSTQVSCKLYARTIITNTWCIHSMEFFPVGSRRTPALLWYYIIFLSRYFKTYNQWIMDLGHKLLLFPGIPCNSCILQ